MLDVCSHRESKINVLEKTVLLVWSNVGIVKAKLGVNSIRIMCLSKRMNSDQKNQFGPHRCKNANEQHGLTYTMHIFFVSELRLNY